MHGSRTWFLPSLAYLQDNTMLQEPTSTSRAAEWKQISGITANKKPDKGCPRTYCDIAGGKWKGKKCWTSQQDTYHLYLWRRRSIFRLTLSRTRGLLQPSPRHPQQHSPDHTLWRPRMEPTTRGRGNSSDQQRKHPTQWNRKQCHSKQWHHGVAKMRGQEA